MTDQHSGETTHQYATFSVDRLFFGIDVRTVQEVLRTQEMTRVPLAPAVVDGLINLRGQIVVAIDMRRRLGLPPRQGGEPMNMVVRGDDGAVSLLVDEIGDVLELGGENWEPPPENLDVGRRGLLDGVHKLDKGLLLILNIARVLDVSGCEAA
ncbi:MAG: chemotaxis protein CheW [Bryobacteraceae bacterium]|jgi:purine-binding chemotaxis protein CheW|nr:chemotaxis protein CheW [Bryobacteraceae bacterium]